MLSYMTAVLTDTYIVPNRRYSAETQQAGGGDVAISGAFLKYLPVHTDQQ